MRDVHVVVVAYGHAEQLARCLATVDGHPVLVVDNSSESAVRGVVEAAGADYHDSGRNGGFAFGVNTALRLLDRDRQDRDVLLLNPDAQMAPGAVGALAQALSRDETLAAVSPSLVGSDGGPQRVVWPWPSPGGAWRVAFRRRDGEPAFLSGAVLLLRREALSSVGGFDERFFLYAEETDWQRRAVNAGWSVRLVSDVQAVHIGGGTSTDSAARESAFHASQELYIRKWFGVLGWCSYRTAVIAGSLVRLLAPRHVRRDAARRLVLYLKGPNKSKLSSPRRSS